MTSTEVMVSIENTKVFVHFHSELYCSISLAQDLRPVLGMNLGLQVSILSGSILNYFLSLTDGTAPH